LALPIIRSSGMYACAVSDPKTRQIVEGADLVLDLGGVNLNDITTASYSAQLDLSRFVTVGLNDVRIGDEVIASVRQTFCRNWPS
jgi:indolepyruvate decarboxylase